MKKILSLVLVLVFALSFSSVALGEYSMTTYRHPVLGYSVQVPAEWLYLDSQNVYSMMKDPSVAKNYPNFNIGNYADQCISNQMALFIEPSGVNFNIVGMNIGQAISAVQLVTLLLPSLQAQYQQLFADVSFPVEGDVFKVGDKEYAYLMYVAKNGDGNIIGAQYCTCESGRLYYVTLTVNDECDLVEYIEIEKMFEKVLASFTE